tara:strand:+ start:22856 stop:23257 length:402 start_codon:yes stop_codon:yes gene_type:complete
MSKLIEYHIILQLARRYHHCDPHEYDEYEAYDVDDSIHVYVERTVTTSDNIIESKDTIEEYHFSYLYNRACPAFVDKYKCALPMFNKLVSKYKKNRKGKVYPFNEVLHRAEQIVSVSREPNPIFKGLPPGIRL